MAKGRKTGGRVKGTPNKVTATVKQAVEKAFEEVGGWEYLVKMADEEPKAFMMLLAKVIPNKIEGELTVTHREVIDALAAGRERIAKLSAEEVLH